ncbi:MAG: transglutaminase TgpA family protein, partial [Woeseiaceae bacterium]
ATPFWSVPIDTSAASSGLNDQMSPGDISSLSLSDVVAFRVSFEGSPPPPNQRYWRGLVLHRFNGRTWSGNEPGPDFRALDDMDVSGDPIAYQVTLEPTQQRWIFALDIPYQVSLDNSYMGPQQQMVSVHPLDRRVAYEAVSYLRYRTNVDLPRTARSWYLRLPDDSNPRTLEMAREMRRAAASDQSYVKDVLQMFHDEEYFYTLEPPALGNNAVDRFLFDTRQGFCEHYASAFAAMMRAAGVPSRIVLGYQGGEMNPVAEYMIVRQSDAHAWTEVWLPGRGWLRVDPTAAVAPERIDSGMSGARFGEAGASWGLTAPSRWLYNLGLTWDALNEKWNGWILGYGPEAQGRFMEWLGMHEPNWRKMLLTLLVLLLALISAISLLLVARYRPPKKDEVARIYRQFVRKAGLLPGVGETPQAYAARLAHANAASTDAANSITNSYLDARYGPPDARALAGLRSAVRNFRASGAREGLHKSRSRVVQNFRGGRRCSAGRELRQ